MSLRPGQLWKCPNGHVLGMIIRNGSGRAMLALYRNALEEEPNPASDEKKEPPPASPLSALHEGAEAAGKGNEVDVMGVVDLKVGTVHDIRCSICGAMKPWVGKKSKIR